MTNLMNTSRISMLTAMTLLAGSVFVYSFVQSHISSFSSISPASQTAAISGAGSGLVAHWALDEGSGAAVNDSSGSGLNGTVHGASWTTGRVGSHAITLAPGQYLDTPVIPGIAGSRGGSYPLTIQAWVRTTDASSDRVVFGLYRSNNRDHFFELRVTNGVASAGVRNASSLSRVTGPNVANGSWHHIVGVFESSTSRRLYVNGVQVGQSSDPVGYPQFADKASIGASMGNYSNQGRNTAITASIDDVRVYTRALSASEVSQLYSLSGSSVPATPPQPSAMPAEPVVTPPAGSPVVSNINAGSITQNAATISWTTNEAADSQVQYGLTTSYGSQTALNASRVTSHSQTITGLLPNTVYNYRVVSRNANGSVTQSANRTFTTAQGVVAAPTVSEPGRCSGVSATVGPVTFDWKFGTAGGDPQCGKFANGDWWISPAPGQSSVVINSVTLIGAGNIQVDENPKMESLGFLTRNYGNQNLAENIIPRLPLGYDYDTSLVAAAERTVGCGTAAITGSCVGAYHVVTILRTPPPGNGADILRPSIDESVKRLVFMNDFDFSRLPSKSYFNGTSVANIENIRRRWSHNLEIFGIVGMNNASYSEGGRAFRASYLVHDYAAGVAAAWNNDLATLFSDKNTFAEKKPAIAAMLVYGKDLYDAVYDNGVRVRKWGGGAGQGLNKYPPAVFFAALAKDRSYGDTLRATTPALLDGDRAPQELEQINPGHNGPTWGDSSTADLTSLGVGSDLNRYWGTLLGSQCFDGAPRTCSTAGGRRTVRDPYNFIDGPENLSGTSYMIVALGPKKSFLGIMSLIPEMCEIVDYPDYAKYIDRVTQKGVQTQPDPCAPPDPREPSTCDAYRKRGCHYYGLSNTGTATWGPDPANPTMCILDPDLEYYNSPTDFACKAGKTCGRFPARDGAKFSPGYASGQIEANWNAIRASAVGVCAMGATSGSPSAPAPLPQQPAPIPVPAPTAPTASTKFQANSRVQVNDGPVSVRSTAAGAIVGQQSVGSLGTVISGGLSAALSGTSYYWWDVNFDSGRDGWVAENFLSAYTAPTPTPAPQPSQPETVFKVGDFNRDGVVNTLDFTMMRARWNTADSIYDLNGDGVVNSLDASILIKNF